MTLAETLNAGCALNEITGPYATSILAHNIREDVPSLSVDKVAAQRDEFMEANPDLVKTLRSVVIAILAVDEGEPMSPNLNLPTVITNKSNGLIPGTGWQPAAAIELTLDRLLREESAGGYFARRAPKHYYESPQFAGEDRSTGHYWSIGAGSAAEPAEQYDDFRPARIFAISIPCDAVTITNRLPEAQLRQIAQRERTHMLHGVALAETALLMKSQLVEAFLVARMVLTDPGVSPAVAENACNRLGFWALNDLTHPNNKEYSPNLHSGITFEKLLYIAQLALADERIQPADIMG